MLSLPWPRFSPWLGNCKPCSVTTKKKRKKEIVNQNHKEIALYRRVTKIKRLKISSDDKNMEQLELPYAAGGSVN